MGKKLDLTGQRFGHLVAIRATEERRREKVFWECQCDCGNMHNVSACDLTSGHTRSCGCQHHPLKHGESKSRLYSIHQGMKRRCYNKNHSSYKDYGGRGITICEEWLNYETFRDWALHNGYNDKLTIERKDNDKGYSPENCTWIARSDQNRNQRSTRHIYIDGEKVTLPMIAEAIGLSETNISVRFSKGIRGLELIRVTKRRKRQTVIEINGVIYNNLQELSDITGVEVGTLRDRYRKGRRGVDLIQPIKKRAHI